MDKEFLDMQRDSMQTASEYIEKLIVGVDTAIEKFQKEETEEALNISSYIEEGIQWLTEIATFTKDVQCENMNEHLMLEKVDMLVDAYENKDYALMGDILEFEIKPLLNKWQQIINVTKC